MRNLWTPVAAGLLLLLGSCAKEKPPAPPRPSAARVEEAKALALAFARALAEQDFVSAHRQLTREHQRAVPLARLREQYEAMMPADSGPVELELVPEGTLTDWPARRPTDVAVLYVSMAGRDPSYSEAVVVTATEEDGQLRLRSVEFGRP